MLLCKCMHKHTRKHTRAAIPIRMHCTCASNASLCRQASFMLVLKQVEDVHVVILRACACMHIQGKGAPAACRFVIQAMWHAHGGLGAVMTAN
jgi:hypothetical protein